jgi:hypothetical protein
MPTKDGADTPDRQVRGRSWAPTAAVAAALALSLFLFYFAVYRTKHYRLPVGFDAPWYVWRASFVGQEGIGPVGTAARPGHAVLSGLLGSVSGLSQLRLAVVFPLLLVAVFALAVGAFASSALDAGPGGLFRWAVTIVVAGTVLGTTRLVGENVATLLTLALVVAALVPLMGFAAGGRGFAGAVVLLVAAGLSHWLFLAVFLAVLLGASLLAAPRSLRDRTAGGRALIRTESGALAGVVGAVAAAMAVLIFGVLQAPLNTIDVPEDPTRFVPKLKTDLRRMFLPALAPAALLGIGAGVAAGRGRPRTRAQALALRILLAWVVVSAAGLVYGVATKDLPPHRFLEIFLAVPGALALTEAVVFAGRWLGRRTSGVARPVLVAGLTAGAVAALAVPGAITWYRHSTRQWIDPVALQESFTASRYLRLIPEGQPVVFIVGASGPAGIISVPLKERTIRVAVAPERQPDVYLFVGTPADFLAGRRTLVPNQAVNEETLPYWEQVRTVLGARPPALALKSLGPRQFADAVGSGAPELGPGVALVRGPRPGAVIAATKLPPAVPSLPIGLLWAAALLALLSAAGAGWTKVFLGPGTSPPVFLALVPAVGCAVLMLGGFVATEIGIRLSGPGGILTYLVVSASGAIGAALGGRSHA